MKSIFLFWMALAAIVLNAATETHTVQIPPQFTGFTNAIEFPQFNPTNGVLVAATLKLDLNLITQTKVENEDNVAWTVVSGSSVTGDLSGLLSGYAEGTFTNVLTSYDGSTDFGGKSGAINPAQTLTESSSVLLVPATVTGTGTVSLTFIASGDSIYEGPGDYTFTVSTKAGAKVTICYEFIPECKPVKPTCPPKPPVCEPKPVCPPKPTVRKTTYWKRR